MKLYFDTIEEMRDCFAKWQDRLGLQSWYIGLALVDKDQIEEGNAGYSTAYWTTKCGIIKILKKEYINDTIIKEPHEATLIHEMLHFKFREVQGDTYEIKYLNECHHQLLEEMAKALFMAEYNLDSEWFVE